MLLPVGDAPLETIELLRDPYVLIVPTDSPLATAPSRRCARSPTSRSSASAQPDRSSRSRRRSAREGIEPRWAFRSNDNPTVQGLVGAGVGSRDHAAADRRRGATRAIAVVELATQSPPRIVAIARHRDRYSSPAARAFVETAREACVYSTVTVFARFRGWSTFRPRSRAMR